MAERTGKEKLEALCRQWKAESVSYCLLLGIGAALLLTAFLYAVAGWSLWTVMPVGAICVAAAFLIYPYWRIDLSDTCRYLDRMLPELEESCGLLLRPGPSLGPLEKLQAEKTAGKLRHIQVPNPMRKKLLVGSALLILGLLASAGVVLAGLRRTALQTPSSVMGPSSDGKVLKEKEATGIRAVTVRITPPAYTGRPVRTQSVFSLRVEEGSVLSWELETTRAVDSAQFIFNDTLHVSLQPANEGHTIWRLMAPVTRSGFYQVRTGKTVTDLYQLEVMPDEAPRVTFRAPKPYTVLDYGESLKVPLAVTIKDDYGISDAVVMATVASGKGEAVKFKEQEIRWGRKFSDGETSVELSKTLDLAVMGLKPGDELYFYCRAKDSHNQEGRTEVYIISLADTAQLMSLEGMTMSTDIKPEYFRSERQIIMETEQLLKEKDTLSLTAFHDRSNGLGIDQKLLRLRYGKFLGEEAEGGELGVDPNDTSVTPVFGDATKILDAFTDKHDNAEDATYFEPAVKQQLKATLSEMWKAELQLRTFQPHAALPFAYKALRLLKDLQQQSRSYVAKTGVRVTPLNPSKRLTGNLTAIQAPLQTFESGTGLQETEVLRIVLGVLEEARMGQPVIGQGSDVLLRQASRRLGREASVRPGEYLDAYQALRNMIEHGRMIDIPAVERAIRKLLPEVNATPATGKKGADAGLSRLYFQHVNDPFKK